MKKVFLLLPVLLLFSFAVSKEANTRLNGVMIDCSRLLEKHDYYYRLLDFMAEWDMNTLLLHFSDDHGLSVALPGYETLAREHAFTPDDIRSLITYAAGKGIDIIPELEVFGHTRYITDHPDYHHLYVGDRSEKVVFNAVDPLNHETVTLMRSMISEVADIFPSQYLHLGCDEVNLDGLGLKNDEAEAETWTDYVNQMIAIAHDKGKKPMIWSDHVRKEPLVADKLDKKVVLVEWNYDPDYVARGLKELKQKGFSAIIMAPSISCWRNRIIPTRPQLRNVDAHARAVLDSSADGMINTVWLPMRYLQESMWYGMAYGAWQINNDKPMKLKKFHREFCYKTFGVRLNNKMDRFLRNWTKLHLDRRYFSAIANQDYTILKDPDRIIELKELYELSTEILSDPLKISPLKHPEILESMYLSAEIVQVLSEGLLIIADEATPDKNNATFRERLTKVIAEAEDEWDRGRFPDDPAKYEAKFPNQTNSHLLVVLRELKSKLLRLSQ